MYQPMWCQIITHLQLNSLLQGNYKIFPEICEKMSKIDVFYPKIKVLLSTIRQIINFLDASANVMSNHHSFTVE